MKRNNCLNLIKFIACIGVVFNHVTFPGLFGQIVKYITFWTVLCFFMIAGYFSYGCDYIKIKKRFIKISKIFIFAFLVFFVYHLFYYSLVERNLGGWFREVFTLYTPIEFAVFCKISWAIPLWYLIAMAETYLFWMIVVRKNATEKVLKFAWLSFTICIVLSVAIDVIGIDWLYKDNFLCSALPCFLFGYLTRAKYSRGLDKISNIKLFLFTVLGWIITVSSVILKPAFDYNYIGVLLSACSLFLIGVKNPDMKVIKPVLYLGDAVSLYIYIFHVPIDRVVAFAFDISKFGRNELYYLIRPVIVVVLTVIVSVCFETIISKTKLKKILF